MTRTLDQATLERLRKQVGFTPKPGIDPFTGRPPRTMSKSQTPRERKVRPKKPAVAPLPPWEPFFGGRNTQRSQESASRDVRLAKQALASELRFSETQFEVILARIEHPYDSIAELGERLGRKKDSVAGALRQVRAKLNHG